MQRCRGAGGSRGAGCRVQGCRGCTGVQTCSASGASSIPDSITTTDAACSGSEASGAGSHKGEGRGEGDGVGRG